jgi:hypothetical protein
MLLGNGPLAFSRARGHIAAFAFATSRRPFYSGSPRGQYHSGLRGLTELRGAGLFAVSGADVWG